MNPAIGIANFLHPDIADTVRIIGGDPSSEDHYEWFFSGAISGISRIPKSTIGPDFLIAVKNMEGRMLLKIMPHGSYVEVIFSDEKDRAVFMLKFK